MPRRRVRVAGSLSRAAGAVLSGGSVLWLLEPPSRLGSDPPTATDSDRDGLGQLPLPGGLPVRRAGALLQCATRRLWPGPRSEPFEFKLQSRLESKVGPGGGVSPCKDPGPREPCTTRNSKP